MLGDNVCPIVFNILGPRPSIPIALDGSKAEIMAETWPGVMSGIWKNIPLGTLLFTNSFNSAKSVLRFDASLLRNISEMDEKYSFSFAAISSDFVYLISSMITSSGKILFELLSLLLIFRKCCHIALVSFESVTESEKCLRLANFIYCLVLFRYVLKSAHNFLRLKSSLFLRACAISSLYQSGNLLVFTRFVL